MTHPHRRLRFTRVRSNPTDDPHMVTIISTEANWVTFQAMNAAAGFTISGGLPLSADGTLPSTNRGTATSNVGDDYVAFLLGLTTPVIEGYTPEEITAMQALLEVTVDAEELGVVLTPREAFDAALVNEGLMQITEEPA